MNDELIFKLTKEDVEFNTSIWKMVETSDPAQLKKITVGRNFLSIDAYPQIQKATKIFGPMGIGFGLTDIEYRIVDDVEASTSKKPGVRDKLMIFSCNFWYKFPGTEKIGIIPIMNSMLLEGRNDAPKKLMTNSISKALSYLGWNFDVFSGSWDDDPYADRPEIPAPNWMKENLNRLLKSGHFTDEQVKKVTDFQINAGWTLQSVQNSVKAAIDKLNKGGHALPDLLEGDDSNGVSEE